MPHTVRINPSAIDEQASVIPNATERNDGVMTKEQVAALVRNTLPDQTGQNGKFLKTNGTSLLWAVAGGGGATLADTYLNGTVAADQTIVIDPLKGGPVVLQAPAMSALRVEAANTTPWVTLDTVVGLRIHAAGHIAFDGDAVSSVEIETATAGNPGSSLTVRAGGAGAAGGAGGTLLLLGGAGDGGPNGTISAGSIFSLQYYMQSPTTHGVLKVGSIITAQLPNHQNTEQYVPDEAGATTWYEWYGEFTNAGGSRKNQTHNSGWNVATGGGSQDGVDWANGDAWESFYNPSAPVENLERHMYFSKPDSTQYRWLSAAMNRVDNILTVTSDTDSWSWYTKNPGRALRMQLDTTGKKLGLYNSTDLYLETNNRSIWGLNAAGDAYVPIIRVGNSSRIELSPYGIESGGPDAKPVAFGGDAYPYYTDSQLAAQGVYGWDVGTTSRPWRVGRFAQGVEIGDTTEPQPAAAAGVRGRLWIVRGGVGVADEMQLCIKNAANTYEWKVVTLT